MFQIECEKPLPRVNCERYGAIAYDGCWFYCTVSGSRSIARFDSCFQEAQCYATSRCYTALCYDSHRACFWAASAHCPAMLFQLDACLAEIDCLKICAPHSSIGVISALSYSCCDDALLVACAAGIVRAELACPAAAALITPAGSAWILGVASLCPYYLVCCACGGKKYVRVYSHAGERLYEMALPCDCCFESAVFFPSKKDFKRCHFYVLVTKHNLYPQVLDCVVTLPALCRSLCSCNYDLCEKSCGGHGGHAHGCGAVMESVALMETSLAHILNAEGEKLQKAIATTDDVETLLRVNASVQKTVERATFLEQVLLSKLEAVCGGDMPDPPCNEACCGCGK